MPDRMSDRVPEHIAEDMPGRMPEDMPDRMPEDMSDRMPEDLPVTKRIDVMVGTTRSKVNHFPMNGIPELLHLALPTQFQPELQPWEKKTKEPSSIPGSRKPFRCRARRVGDDRVSDIKEEMNTNIPQRNPSGVNISDVLFTMGK